MYNHHWKIMSHNVINKMTYLICHPSPKSTDLLAMASAPLHRLSSMTSVPLMSSSAATRRRSIPQRRRYAPRLSPHSNPGQCTSARFDLFFFFFFLSFFVLGRFFPVSCCRVMGVLSFWTEMLHSRPRRRRRCFVLLCCCRYHFILGFFLFLFTVV
jgi:hypothetical protein